MPYRGTYTASDTWALIEMLKRVPDRFAMELKPGSTDRNNLLELLGMVGGMDFLGQGRWAGNFADEMVRFPRMAYWSRERIINLIAILYTICYGASPVHYLFDSRMVAWAMDFYASLADVLDIELV